ncbi:hypothetical protein [Streptomyces sp. NBC_01483]|uniref:hypothetical protein n=1 Tax=Streptomyces sp. NBC_01483 TaxID=2903883 RepID=UPI003FCEA7A5
MPTPSSRSPPPATAARATRTPAPGSHPPRGYRGQYATDWVADKTRWGLTIDPTEHAALSDALSNCPDQPITVTLAR